MISLGNDVSDYQGDIDFDVYKNNANFLITKSTEGTGFTAKKLYRNQSECRRVGLAIGYYHFARPDAGNSPEAEADYFVSKIGVLKDGEVLVLDYEPPFWQGDQVAWCKRWLDRVASKTNGTKPLIYLNQSQMALNWKPVIDAGYGLWIAAYTGSPTNNNFNHGAWPVVAMQQWTNQQRVPGIQGGNANVDGDVFFGDIATFKKYGYKNPTPTPPPPPPTDFENLYNEEKAKNNTLTGQVSTLTEANKNLSNKIEKAKTDLS